MTRELSYLHTDFFELRNVSVEETKMFQYAELQGYAETKIDRVPVTIFFTIIHADPEDSGTLYLNVCPANTSVDDFESSENQIVVRNFTYAINI